MARTVTPCAPLRAGACAPWGGRSLVARGFAVPLPNLETAAAVACLDAAAPPDPRRALAPAAARDRLARAATLQRAVSGIAALLDAGRATIAYVADVSWHRSPVPGEPVAPVASVQYASTRGGVAHVTLRGELLARGGRRIASFRLGVDCPLVRSCDLDAPVETAA